MRGSGGTGVSLARPSRFCWWSDGLPPVLLQAGEETKVDFALKGRGFSCAVSSENKVWL